MVCAVRLPRDGATQPQEDSIACAKKAGLRRDSYSVARLMGLSFGDADARASGGQSRDAFELRRWCEVEPFRGETVRPRL